MLGIKNDHKGKVKALDERYTALQTEKTELQTKRDQLEKKIKAVKDKGVQHAENGEIDKYRALAEELRKYEDDLYVTNTRLDKLKTISFSIDEISEAWKEYHEKYAEEIRAEVKKFSEMKAELMKQYEHMIDVQEEAVTIRDRFKGYMGSSYDKALFDKKMQISGIPYRTAIDGVIGLLSLAGGGTTARDPDLIYFLSYYCLTHNINGLQLQSDANRIRYEAVVGLRSKRPQ